MGAAAIDLLEYERTKPLAERSHAELYNLRGQLPKDQQNKVAPYEHRAFAREAVAENPAMAASLAVAIPLYSAAKALGLSKARSGASLDEMAQGYTGIGEGLKRFWNRTRK